MEEQRGSMGGSRETERALAGEYKAARPKLAAYHALPSVRGIYSYIFQHVELPHDFPRESCNICDFKGWDRYLYLQYTYLTYLGMLGANYVSLS